MKLSHPPKTLRPIGFTHPTASDHRNGAALAGLSESANSTKHRRWIVLPLILLAFPAFSHAQIAPSISRQPLALSRSIGDRVTLSVTASGDDPLRYQWYRDELPIEGATSRSITFTNLVAANSGSYRVEISNSIGTVSSKPAFLEVDTLFTYLLKSSVAQMVHGDVSWGDFDGDGWVDIFSGGFGTSALLRNERNGTFSVVGRTNAIVARRNSGNSVMGLWADFNNDGNLDLLVPQGPSPDRTQLFRGLGGGSFEFVTNSIVTRTSTSTFSAVWADFNRDGLLDIFLANAGPVPPETATNTFYLGQRNGDFLPWGPSGLNDVRNRHYGATSGDFDGDGWTDLAVPANPLRRNLLFLNQQGLDFDAMIFANGGGSGGSAAAADFDNDGKLDLFVAWNTEHSHLYRNMGDGTFEEVLDAAMLLEAGRSNGAAWGDYDNDGWLDLFLSRTGNNAGDGDNRDSLYHNNGDGTFTRVQAGSVGADSNDSSGTAWADMNNDGFLDLVVASDDSNPSRLFQNNGNTNSWLLMKLTGTTSNRSGLGARIQVTAHLHGQSITQLREIGTGTGWFAQNDLRAHFGLADAPVAETIVVLWPSGLRQTFHNVPTRQILEITEPTDALMLQFVRSEGRMNIEVQGSAGTLVVLQRSTDLLDWEALSPKPLEIPPSGKLKFPLPAEFEGLDRFLVRGFYTSGLE